MVLQSVNGGQNKLRCNRLFWMQSNCNDLYIDEIKIVLSKLSNALRSTYNDVMCEAYLNIKIFFVPIHLYHNKRKYLIVILTLWHFPEG